MPERDAYGGLRTYGRRKGPRLSARKQALVDGLLPRLRVDPDAPAPAPLTGLFETPVESVALEIGFGAGEHLVQQAAAHPDCGFIGCEVYINGVAALLGQLEETGLRNIRLHDGDARPLLEWLPEAALSRVFVLFPDPWPKKRHHKRRLIAPETLARLARAMRRGAELRIASDIPDYIRTALLAARDSGDFEWRAEGPRDWRERPADWPQTRYERRALEAGRACSYLSFIRR